jgi:hypothetical protein
MTIFKIIIFITAIIIVIISGTNLDNTNANLSANRAWFLSLIGWMTVALITLFVSDCNG